MVRYILLANEKLILIFLKKIGDAQDRLSSQISVGILLTQ